MTDKPEPHDPATPVTWIEELESLLIAGLESGKPTPMTEVDWDALRRRAVMDAQGTR